MHAELHAPEPVVVAAAMTGIADEMVRDVMEVLEGRKPKFPAP